MSIIKDGLDFIILMPVTDFVLSLFHALCQTYHDFSTSLMLEVLVDDSQWCRS